MTYDDTIDAILDDPRFRRAIDPVRAAILMDAETAMIDQQATARIEAATEREAGR